jgi:hypothetical protein
MYEGWVGWFGGACLQLSLLVVVVVVVVLTGALQAVFVSVRAYNLAGLHTTVLASGLAVDTTPPQRGFVHDGEHNATGGRDVDYQVRVRRVRVCVLVCVSFACPVCRKFACCCPTSGCTPWPARSWSGLR